MKLIIKLFGILSVLSGVSLLINPEFFFGWIENNMENASFYIFAIGVRLVFGLMFIIAAKESKYPGVIKFFGYLAVITAVTFILIGHESFQDLFSSLIPGIKPYAPLSGLIDIAIGSFLIYAFSWKKSEN
jgi:hypothetical protein